MSLESMCSGSTVVKQSLAHTVGDMGDDTTTFTDGETLECGCQIMSASEEFRFTGHGEQRAYMLFFSQDPGLTVDNRLRLTKISESDVSPAIILNVKNAYREDRPGGGLALWIADTDEVTTQFQTDAT